MSCLYTNVYSAYCKISFAVGWYTIQELFRRLPHQRKLSESERHEAETMLSPKANKMIQDKLVRETSKAVILKDLSNISTRMQSGNTRNDLEESIKRLTDKYGEFLGHTHTSNINDQGMNSKYRQV